MPIYEYECKECKERFESYQSVKDYQKPQPCPTCGKEAPRVYSRPAIHTADMWSN